MHRKILEQTLSIGARAAFILCLIVAAILALLPADLMKRTALGGHAEHVVAYLGTAVLMGLAFPRRGLRLIVQCVLLTMYASVLEAGQLYSPGRHASFRDLAFSVGGIVIGGLLLEMFRRRISNWLRHDKST
jgi:VanZ family protein